jgi:N-acetylglucosaminyl-diphospho-decaprenol L-rhamnosyltransferase
MLYIVSIARAERMSMISIVIVNWNSGGLLKNCIQSLLRNAEGYEILVVDNASSDSSLDFLQEFNERPAILRNERNIGFAAANNLGWRTSKGDAVLFLNPDTECFPESVSCLEKTLAADAGVWAVAGQLIGTDGKPQSEFNVRAFPSLGSLAAEMLLVDKIRKLNPWAHAHGAQEKSAVDVDQPAAACLMVARTALESLGGFDEDFYPAWFEDVDLCRRIRDRHGRIRYQPAARFLHHGGYSAVNMSRRNFLEVFHRNRILYFRKHHGIRAARRAKQWILSGLLLRSALALARSPAPGMSRKDSSKAFLYVARRIARLREAEL